MSKVPEDYHLYHSPRCGTEFRGCAPECPKDIYDRTGKWKPLKGKELKTIQRLMRLQRQREHPDE